MNGYENFTQNLSDVAENPECVNPDDKDEFKELAKQTIINFSTRLNEEITQTMTIDGLVEELYYPVLSKYLTIEDIKVLIKFYESPSILKFIQERNIIDQEIDESADHYIKKLEDVSKEICESEKTKLFNQFD